MIHLKAELEKLVEEGKGDTGLVVRSIQRGGLDIAINAHQVFPSASVIKVPLACVVLSQAAAGKLDLAQPVPLTTQMRVGGSGVLQYLQPGLRIRLEDALVLAIIVSDNVATNILIDAAGGFEVVNNQFADWGLSVTRLSRYMMDLEARAKGIDNWTSAQEIASLLERLYKRELLPDEQSQRLLDILAAQQVNHKLPEQWPEKIWFAHKTGEFAGGIDHDVGILCTEEDSYVVAVVTARFPSNHHGRQHVRAIGGVLKNFLM